MSNFSARNKALPGGDLGSLTGCPRLSYRGHIALCEKPLKNRGESPGLPNKYFSLGIFNTQKKVDFFGLMVGNVFFKHSTLITKPAQMFNLKFFFALIIGISSFITF